jgi:hypothetical protein
MSDFRRTFSITSDHEVNGLSRTAYAVADRLQIDCKIDREVIKTGWFSKRYEYHITYSGDKDKVSKAILTMRDNTEAYNARIHAQQGTTECDSGW